ncbi:MAG: response regulator, partial [Paracoccaceae bacterium]|nr:response regulator [Paracoccaceae bacterium]
VNARDAMPEGGVLVIETENLEIGQEHLDEKPDGLAPGRYVMLAISDTGQGIPPEVIDKVFDPFFSTKGPMNNSGLGLSMVHGFMKQSGGSVRIYSEPGVGTTVKLLFPASHNGDPSKPEDTSPPEMRAHTARILVAEDQPEVLTLLRRSLEAQGHEVITATNGDTAAELFQTSGPIDLLVTDIVMPGTLQGPGLAKHLRSLAPDLPVVFMSGYASEASLHGNGLREEDQRLMKPVARKQLIEAVNTALLSRQ